MLAVAKRRVHRTQPGSHCFFCCDAQMTLHIVVPQKPVTGNLLISVISGGCGLLMSSWLGISKPTRLCFDLNGLRFFFVNSTTLHDFPVSLCCNTDPVARGKARLLFRGCSFPHTVLYLAEDTHVTTPEQSPESFQQGGLTIWKHDKTPLIHCVSYFSLGGLGALFWGIAP